MNKENLVRLGVDAFKTPSAVLEFSREKGKDANQVMRNAFLDILGLEEGTRITPTQFERKMRGERGIQVYEIIEEILRDTFMTGIDENEFFMRFADIRNLALGDENRFTVMDDSVATVSEVAKGSWDIQREKIPQGESFKVNTRDYGIAVYDDFYQFIVGNRSFTDFIQHVATAFDRHINQMVAGAFGNVASTIAPEFATTGAFDLEELQSIVDHVEASNKSGAIVVGTRTALSKVVADADVDWITPEQKEQRQRTGMVGYYEGMTLVQLPRVFKQGTLEFAYDDKNLLILPADETIKPIKLVFEGEAVIRSNNNRFEYQDHTHNYQLVQTYGAEVVFDGAFGIYSLVD